MAKLYSSLHENTIYHWEHVVRPYLIDFFSKDLDNEEKMFKDLVVYMKALHKIDRLGFKIQSTLLYPDDPKVIKWQKEYDAAKEKQKVFVSKFGQEMWRVLFIFVMQLYSNGLKKMICEDGIARWLTASPGEFNYYEWRP